MKRPPRYAELSLSVLRELMEGSLENMKTCDHSSQLYKSGVVFSYNLFYSLIYIIYNT